MWNARLLRTAGQCVTGGSSSSRSAKIELSEKVLDSADRLRTTLAHEMCHAASWLLDGVRKPPHGPSFQKWGRAFEQRVPGMRVTTCHAYDIFEGKFRYGCETCGSELARHSKSLDVERQCCAICHGRLRFLGTFNKDGTPAKTREPSAFARFVKDHYAAIKREMASAAHKELMAELGRRFREDRVQGTGAELGKRFREEKGGASTPHLEPSFTCIEVDEGGEEADGEGPPCGIMGADSPEAGGGLEGVEGALAGLQIGGRGQGDPGAA